MEFAGKLAREIRRSGLSKNEVIRRTNLDRSHFYKLLRGDHLPNRQTRDLLADALGVPRSFFDPATRRTAA